MGRRLRPIDSKLASRASTPSYDKYLSPKTTEKNNFSQFDKFRGGIGRRIKRIERILKRHPGQSLWAIFVVVVVSVYSVIDCRSSVACVFGWNTTKASSTENWAEGNVRRNGVPIRNLTHNERESYSNVGDRYCTHYLHTYVCLQIIGARASDSWTDASG